MSANNTSSERRRSRPVTNKNKFHFLKGQRLAALLILVIFLVSVIAGSLFIFLPDDTNENNTNDTNPIAVISTTMGIIKVELYQDKVPITAGNFIDLANSGYYDGVIFHRVIPNFMIQGGDPNGDGTGGHAAKYHDGYGDPDDSDSWVIPDEFREDLSNVRGTISMANRGANTGGSQFFINLVDNSYLDYNKEPLTSKHAVFGRVISGMDIVDKISEVKTDSSNNKPETNIVINSITIED